MIKFLWGGAKFWAIVKICTISAPSIFRSIERTARSISNLGWLYSKYENRSSKKSKNYGEREYQNYSNEAKSYSNTSSNRYRNFYSYEIFCSDGVRLPPGCGEYVKVNSRYSNKGRDVVPVLSSFMYDKGVFIRTDRYINISDKEHLVYLHNSTDKIIKIEKGSRVGMIMVR